MNRTLHAIVASTLLLAVTSTVVLGSFVEYTSFDEWQAAAGSYTTIGFDEVPSLTFVSDEYESLGVLFPSMFDYTTYLPGPDGESTFPIDGAGLQANWHPVELVFDSPQNWIGMHHPGFVQILLYAGDTRLYDTWFMGGSGTNFFSGVVSTVSFDRVIIKDPFGDTFAIDDLYFGGVPIPAPPVASVFVLAGLLGGSRRRRE